MRKTNNFAAFNHTMFNDLTIHWYRNTGRTRYHAARTDWIQSGRAVCGADISHPGFAHYGPTVPAIKPACKHCLKGIES